MSQVSQVKLNDHIFASLVHGGILIAILCLVTISSCQEPPPPPREPDPVGDFFEGLQDGLDEASADTVTILGVEDNSGTGPDLQRLVRQEILAELNQLETVQILEYPQTELDIKYIEMEITLSDGISPDKARALAESLMADALLYAAIESDAPDVHIKIYSAETGGIVFAETLQEWPLPITEEEETFDLLGGSSLSETGEDSEPDETSDN